jgi:hypothetical protein
LGVSETNRGITSELKTARAKSMNGEDDMKWGVHFVNGTSDYYELFSTPTNYADGSRVTKETVYLSGGVAFSYPTEGNTTDIIFDKIYGSTTPATYVTVTAENNYATTTISSNGQIY